MREGRKSKLEGVAMILTPRRWSVQFISNCP